MLICLPFPCPRCDYGSARRLITALLAVLVGAVSPAAAQSADAAADGRSGIASWRRSVDGNPSRFNLSARGGRGLIMAVSPDTLAPGEWAMNGFELNYDRHPGDVDFFEFGFQMAVGIPWGLEGFVRYSPTLRVNSVGQHPIEFPVPPVDLLVDVYPTDATRAEPIHLFAQEVPYKTYPPERVIIAPPGDGAFSSSQGDVVFGLKKSLLSETRGDRLGFGLRGYVEIPIEKPDYNTTEWRKFGGVSGEIDFGFDLLWSKEIWTGDTLFNLGYKRTGDPTEGLRIQYVDSSAIGTPEFLVSDPVAFELGLRDELSLHFGSAWPIFELLTTQVYLIGEFSYKRYVGNGTPVERLVHPAEMRLGLQFNMPWFYQLSIGMAWQLLFNDAGDGSTRQSPLVTADGRGDINFGDLIDENLAPEVREFFESQGVTFRPNSSRVFTTDNAVFDTWRNIDPGPLDVLGQGGGNILAYLTWRIGAVK